MMPRGDMRSRPAVRLVEAAYALDLDEEQWLAGIETAARSVDLDGLGLVAVAVHERVANGTELRSVHASSPAFAACYHTFFRGHQTSLGDMHRLTTCASTTEVHRRHPDTVAAFEALRAALAPLGAQDCFNVQGASDRRSLTITVGCRREMTIPPRTRDVWTRVAVHLAAALRLRDNLTSRPTLDDGAVLDAEGRVAHDAGVDAHGLARLRRAAQDQLQARNGPTRDDPRRALDLWRGLVAGRWSLVDIFDTDGRRFLVARENAPGVREATKLTRRERQVATLVAAGEGLTTTAYALGLSASTVSTHLSRAMNKLGVRNPAELIQVMTHLGAAERGD